MHFVIKKAKEAAMKIDRDEADELKNEILSLVNPRIDDIKPEVKVDLQL